MLFFLPFDVVPLVNNHLFLLGDIIIIFVVDDFSDDATVEEEKDKKKEIIVVVLLLFLLLFLISLFLFCLKRSMYVMLHRTLKIMERGLSYFCSHLFFKFFTLVQNTQIL